MVEREPDGSLRFLPPTSIVRVTRLEPQIKRNLLHRAPVIAGRHATPRAEWFVDHGMAFFCCCVPSYLRHMPPSRRDGKHPNRANERASERTNSRPDGKSCQYHNRKQTIMSSLWSVCVFASLVSLPQWFPSTYTLPPTYNYNFVIFFYQPFARKLNSLLRKGLFKKKVFFYFVFSATVYARALLHHLPRPQRATTDDTPLCASFHF